ncbi:HEPN domain-containing protein [Microbacterium sp. Leaf161]|uniref:ApeA N-terminal domain 1-containing protein n=1 Tax=Microbacterium sp. Leaf161 TaxID=1736281 RepID=UPI0012FAA6CE|nr:HEPN domain-containing protein [Microbacterium sp. Leaf161]
MVSKSWRGYWWLPSSPDARVPGRLVVEEDGRCELQIIGGLDMGKATSRQLSERVPAIFGDAEGQRITVTDCFVVRQDGFGGPASQFQDIHVHEALVGVHVAPEEAVFESAIVTIEHLSSWLAIQEHVSRDGTDGVESAATRRPSERSCEVDGWTFTARPLVQPFHVVAQRARLTVNGEISNYLVIRAPRPVAAGGFDKPVLELMDLLTLASGEPSGQIALTLIHKDPNEQLDRDGSSLSLERRVECFGARTHTAMPTESAVPDWRFLFTCADKSFEELVPAWLALRRRAPEACNVYFGMKYARPNFTEVRLLMIAITAETLHQSIREDETELPPEMFTDLRARVLASLEDADERRWVKARLRNAPSFLERLSSLVSIPSEAAVTAVIPDIEVWSRALRDARNNLAHTGNNKSDEDIFVLENITASLLTLVLMSELGLTEETQDRAALQVLAPSLPPIRP